MVLAQVSPIVAYLMGVATVGVPLLIWAVIDGGSRED